jgi:hypothetical protein
MISEDKIVADATGAMASKLVSEADQRFLSDRLDRASVIVHGRNSHEISRNPGAATTNCEPQDSVNCQGSRPAAGCCGILPVFPWRRRPRSLASGMERLRILGGTEIFGLFLPRYDVFHLLRVAGLRLSGGRPVFPQVPQFSVEAVLASSKLSPTAQLPLDEARGVTLSLGFERFAAVKSPGVRVMPASF